MVSLTGCGLPPDANNMDSEDWAWVAAAPTHPNDAIAPMARLAKMIGGKRRGLVECAVFT